MNCGEHFGIAWRAFGRKLDFTAANELAPLFEDMNDIEGGAGTKPEEQHFERPHAEITAAALRRAVHYDCMAAARFTDEGSAFQPLDARFHFWFSLPTLPASSPRFFPARAPIRPATMAVASASMSR